MINKQNNGMNKNNALTYLGGQSSFNRRFFRPSKALCRKDFYNELNISKSAGQDDIKKAYFKLAKEYHPDVNKAKDAKEKFNQINEAYETLGDDNKRRIYD